MHLLIYGFGPYLGFHDNVTEKIVRKLPKRRWLKKVIFPVRFHRSQFINAIKAYDPDVILGLGQCSRGRLLRIESTAINQRRNSKSEKARRIAAVRHLALSRVMQLISAHTDGRFLGLFGEPGVNVLELNIALDNEVPSR